MNTPFANLELPGEGNTPPGSPPGEKAPKKTARHDRPHIGSSDWEETCFLTYEDNILLSSQVVPAAWFWKGLYASRIRFHHVVWPLGADGETIHTGKQVYTTSWAMGPGGFTVRKEGLPELWTGMAHATRPANRRSFVPWQSISVLGPSFWVEAEETEVMALRFWNVAKHRLMPYLPIDILGWCTNESISYNEDKLEHLSMQQMMFNNVVVSCPSVELPDGDVTQVYSKQTVIGNSRFKLHVTKWSDAQAPAVARVRDEPWLRLVARA